VKLPASSFPRRRESSLLYKLRVADNFMFAVLTHGVVRVVYVWIPACAGTTANVKVSVMTHENINSQ